MKRRFLTSQTFLALAALVSAATFAPQSHAQTDGEKPAKKTKDEKKAKKKKSKDADDCCAQKAQDSNGKMRADVEALRDAIAPKKVGVDIGFWSVTSSDTHQVELQYHQPSSPPSGSAEEKLYYDLANLLTAPGASNLKADTYAQYMDDLKSGSSLPTDLKLTILARIGKELAADYDDVMAETGDLTAPKLPNEQIFENARAAGKHGGICGNIHEFIRHAASAMGLEAYTLSTTWRDDRGSGGHVLAGYRDPKTGDIYIQNYDDVVKVGNSSGSGPRDIAEAANLFMNGQTATSFVEDEKGHEHLYLTNTGKLILDSIRRAEAVVPNTEEGGRVTITLQTNYRNLGYSQFLGKKQKSQFFIGTTTLNGSSILPAFQQSYLGFSRKSDLGGNIGKTGLRYDVNNRLTLGVQDVLRDQLTTSGVPLRLNEQSAFIVEKAQAQISYSSPDQKTKIAAGTQVEIDLLDASLNSKRLGFWNSNVSTPYHWVQNYLTASKKISSEMKIGVTVSEVQQITPGQLTQYFPLNFTEASYSAVEVEVIKSGKQMFLRSAGKLYILPEDGTAMTATVDWVQKIRQQKGATISAFGSGTVGFNPTAPEDQWYKLKDYVTARIGVNADKRLPGVRKGAVLGAGAGFQYQGNTPGNSFDVQQQAQISQFLTNPQGASGFVYLRLKF